MIKLISRWIQNNWWRFSPLNIFEKFERHSFDLRYGTDTQNDVSLLDLRIDSPNKIHGIRYHATPPFSFRRVLKKINIDFSDYTFIDFGSGKGRTLLVASDFPFKRIVGVEFGEELHRCALSNIEKYKSTHNCQVKSIHADATQFRLPEGNLVIYFFNPFDDVILRQVLSNIKRAARSHATRVFIVYLYLQNKNVFHETGDFVSLFNWHKFNVFECRPIM